MRIGIGKDLLDMGLAILMDQGVELVMLNVESSRRPAISFAMDSKASIFFAMELQVNKKNTFAPYLPLSENPKHNLNGILPPFEAEGQDGVTWDEML